MKTPIVSFLFLFFLVLGQAPLLEAAPGKGRGHGRMPDEFRGVIHSLFADHGKIERSVKKSKTGYTARTISTDKKVARRLQQHVGQMESRLENGFGVRQWDPAFAEFRRHYDDLETTIENIEGGVEVTVTGKTPEAIRVARNHAKIISGFIKNGPAKMHATHEPALTKATSSDRAKTGKKKSK